MSEKKFVRGNARKPVSRPQPPMDSRTKRIRTRATELEESLGDWYDAPITGLLQVLATPNDRLELADEEE